MAETTKSAGRRRAGTPLTASVPRIPVLAFGMSLGLFLAVTFTLCVGFDLLFPSQAMYETWLKLLPGFTWLTWPSFFLGLAAGVAYGWGLLLTPALGAALMSLSTIIVAINAKLLERARRLVASTAAVAAE